MYRAAKGMRRFPDVWKQALKHDVERGEATSIPYTRGRDGAWQSGLLDPALGKTGSTDPGLRGSSRSKPKTIRDWGRALCLPPCFSAQEMLLQRVLLSLWSMHRASVSRKSQESHCSCALVRTSAGRQNKRESWL